VTIDREGPEPVYRQVAAVLRARIEAGEILPRRPLPSETSLMGEFGIARETARKAVRVLRDEGLVQIVQGRGAFVITPK
jgi:DNA-binding GntR family transcriptional regulator